MAGIAAAAAANGLGGRGVAPEVTLVGFNPAAAALGDPDAALFRSLGGSENDPDSASVDIFNMSYGTVVPERESPGRLRSADGGGDLEASGRARGLVREGSRQRFRFLRTGATRSVGEVGCVGANTDPEQNVPYLINVGAFNADDVKSSYSSAGANLWVVGPGGEDGIEQPAMITTDQAGTEAGFDLFFESPLSTADPRNPDGDYITGFGGTSSAAPAVAGALAVLLGVNPDLTWRDVKHILALTSRKIDAGRREVRAAFNGSPYVAQHAWQTNAAGYEFHNWYGFGAVDVDAAVAMAAGYTPDSLGPFVESQWFEPGQDAASPRAVPDADGAGASAAMWVAGLPDADGAGDKRNYAGFGAAGCGRRGGERDDAGFRAAGGRRHRGGGARNLGRTRQIRSTWG